MDKKEEYSAILAKCKLDENFKIKCKLRVLKDNKFKWKEVDNIESIHIDGCEAVNADVLTKEKEVMLYKSYSTIRNLERKEKDVLKLGETGVKWFLFDFIIEKAKDGKRIARVESKVSHPCE